MTLAKQQRLAVLSWTCVNSKPVSRSQRASAISRRFQPKAAPPLPQQKAPLQACKKNNPPVSLALAPAKSAPYSEDWPGHPSAQETLHGSPHPSPFSPLQLPLSQQQQCPAVCWHGWLLLHAARRCRPWRAGCLDQRAGRSGLWDLAGGLKSEVRGACQDGCRSCGCDSGTEEMQVRSKKTAEACLPTGKCKESPVLQHETGAACAHYKNLEKSKTYVKDLVQRCCMASELLRRGDGKGAD